MAIFEGKEIKGLTITIETDKGTETLKIKGKDIADFSDDARLTEWHDGMQIGYVESARRMMRVDYVKQG
jgi:hypothetical protein